MPPRAPVVVILNPAAGGAKRRDDLDRELPDLFRASATPAEFVILQEAQTPADVAREASTRASIVVAAGGDGTVSGVVAGMLDSKAALGILPLGTLNHFAKDLQIPLDPGEAVAVIAGGHVQRVDVARVNERIFVNNSSIGVYAGIIEAREQLRREGYRKWTAHAIAMVRVLERYRGVAVRMSLDGRDRAWQTPFVFVGNNEYAIDGIQLGGRTRLDRGRLFIYLAPEASARDLPVLFVKALFGRARQSRAFEIVSTTELTIGTRARRIRIAIDGELTTMTAPLRYRTCPGALPVIVPRG